jgi:hypothetical protein
MNDVSRLGLLLGFKNWRLFVTPEGLIVFILLGSLASSSQTIMTVEVASISFITKL